MSKNKTQAKAPSAPKSGARKAIPRFRTEAEERRFWEIRDSADYVDWAGAMRARFPNLKPSTKATSLRLPAALLDRIKIEANRRDVPYQSLIKVWLKEKTDTRDYFSRPRRGRE